MMISVFTRLIKSQAPHPMCRSLSTACSLFGVFSFECTENCKITLPFGFAMTKSNGQKVALYLLVKQDLIFSN